MSIDLPSGAGQTASLAFDRGREEVRLNPALEGLLGKEAFAQWRSAAEDLLKRPALRLGEAMDGFGHLADLPPSFEIEDPAPHRAWLETGARHLAAMIETLTDAICLHGIPEHIHCDNGPEMISKALRKWVSKAGAQIQYIGPRLPRENGYCERFSGKIQYECLI